MTSATPAVSVLLPTHNNAPYLRAAVKSVLAQTFSDFELIVIDDGSADGTPTLLRELAAGDARLRVLTHAAPLGIEAALNRALDLSRAPLIARMDGDDLCLPQRLERQVAALETLPEVVVLGAQADTFGDVQTRFDYPVGPEETRAHALFECPLCHPAVLIRRSALVRVGGYPLGLPYSEDYALWTELLRIGELASLPEVLLHYRRHAGSVSATRQAEARASKRRIWAAALPRLGLEVTAADLDSHGQFWPSLHHLTPVTAVQKLAAERWAERLLDANRRTGQIDQGQLERQLRLRLQGMVIG